MKLHEAMEAMMAELEEGSDDVEPQQPVIVCTSEDYFAMLNMPGGPCWENYLKLHGDGDWVMKES